jgi:hypothetical protein
MRTSIIAAALLVLIAVLPALDGADPPADQAGEVATPTELASAGEPYRPLYLLGPVSPTEPQTGIGTSPVVEPPAGEVVAGLYDSIRQSRWLVIVLRRYLGKLLPWVRTKAGAFVLAFGSATLLVGGLALGAGRPLDPSLITTACAAAWAAAGGWGHAKDVFPWLGVWVDPDHQDPESGT